MVNGRRRARCGAARPHRRRRTQSCQPRSNPIRKMPSRSSRLARTPGLMQQRGSRDPLTDDRGPSTGDGDPASDLRRLDLPSPSHDGRRSISPITWPTAAEPSTTWQMPLRSTLHTLRRLLAVLTAVGLCERTNDSTVTLTPLGSLLRSDTQGSLKDVAWFITAPWMLRVWEALPDALRTGDQCSTTCTAWRSWSTSLANPEQGAVFDAAMTGSAEGRAAAILDTVRPLPGADRRRRRRRPRAHARCAARSQPAYARRRRRPARSPRRCRTRPQRRRRE